MAQALEVRDRELARLRAQLEATGRVLRVISDSLSDPQPVFSMLAGYAVELCDARYAGVLGFDGELLHLHAQHGLAPEEAEIYRESFPRPPGRDSAAGRAVLNRALVHIPDVCVDSEYELGALARAGNVRSIVAVPMLRIGAPIGAIVAWRSRPEPFSDDHIALLDVFAAQAAIAIENVRLRHELEKRDREVTKMLEQQSATAELLRVAAASSGPMSSASSDTRSS
ncbi:MAG: GAF domain-containing protein [Gammaproteobacteria bacterium]|nr:GAF domain-containing protein [Gammaproteobacteria bacterium]